MVVFGITVRIVRILDEVIYDWEVLDVARLIDTDVVEESRLWTIVLVDRVLHAVQ